MSDKEQCLCGNVMLDGECSRCDSHCSYCVSIRGQLNNVSNRLEVSRQDNEWLKAKNSELIKYLKALGPTGDFECSMCRSKEVHNTGCSLQSLVEESEKTR